MADDEAGRKRKRSAAGCAHEGNDLVVEELRKIRARLREPSHLASNFGRAIAAIQAHPERIADGRQAKQLRNIGNYMANQIQAILNKQRGGSSGGAGGDSAADATSGGETQRTREATASSSSDPPRRKKQKPQQPQQRSEPAFPSIAVADAAGDGVTSREKMYAPSQGKQPWFVLLVLQRSKAWDDDSAMSLEDLLSQMQRAGYSGTMPKLKACLAILCSTHEVAKRTINGGVFLTVKGQESADRCPGELSDTGATASTAPSSSVPSLDAVPQSDSSSLASLQTRIAASTACNVADDDEDNLSEPETVVAASDDILNQSQPESEIGYDFDFSFDPDEEPPSLAERLERRLHKPNTNSVQRQEPSSGSSSKRSLSSSTVASTALSAHKDGDEWELVLLLDHREILSRRNRSILERKLLERGITCEVRALNVGDVQWIARRYRPGDDRVSEFMLNAIVERKEVNDLSGSIIDRRYFEQKTRLGACGLTHVIYLVEGSLTQQQTTIRSSGLETAMCRTQVQNQFFVQLCRSSDESLSFLSGVHMRLLAKFPPNACRNAELHSIENSARRESPFLPSSATQASDTRAFDAVMCQPLQLFASFNAQFRKKSQFTVGEMYQMMLMQAPGLSAAKTAALYKTFSTFHELRAALQISGKKNPIDEVRCGESQRRVGIKTRQGLAQLLTASEYIEDTETV